MKVIAKKGARCPKEGRPREYITDSAPVDVSETPYYKRLVGDGSLVIAERPDRIFGTGSMRSAEPKAEAKKTQSEIAGPKSRTGGKR